MRPGGLPLSQECAHSLLLIILQTNQLLTRDCTADQPSPMYQREHGVENSSFEPNTLLRRNTINKIKTSNESPILPPTSFHKRHSRFPLPSRQRGEKMKIFFRPFEEQQEVTARAQKTNIKKCRYKKCC